MTAEWLVWALLSALFAALTAVCAKAGLQNVDSDFAVLLRTAVVGAVLAGAVYCAGKWQNPLTLSRKAAVFIVLSGLAAGASWGCYFRALKTGPLVLVLKR